jgi:hypothetical protein
VPLAKLRRPFAYAVVLDVGSKGPEPTVFVPDVLRDLGDLASHQSAPDPNQQIARCASPGGDTRIVRIVLGEGPYGRRAVHCQEAVGELVRGVELLSEPNPVTVRLAVIVPEPLATKSATGLSISVTSQQLGPADGIEQFQRSDVFSLVQ